MLIPILGGVATLILVFIVIVALQPAAFRVARSATISAPPEAVFPHVNELRQWEAWSPWAKLDPTMKQTYDGPPSGTGAVSAWLGDKKVGEGRMTITQSKPSERIELKLEFLRPFKATNTSEFTFRRQGNQTAVEWSMTGNKNFMSKAFCMFMNMDKMVGGDFEKGLASLKAVAEGSR